MNEKWMLPIQDSVVIIIIEEEKKMLCLLYSIMRKESRFIHQLL